MPPTHKPLDIARCFTDAADVYRKHFLTLFLASILFEILSLCSLLVLAGPLWGGICIMSLRAMTQPDAQIRLGDLFSTFDKFGALVAIFFILMIAGGLGLLLLVVPGVLLAALWLFPTYLVVDRNLGVSDALRSSWRIVVQRGLWINVALAAIILAISIFPAFLPYVGWVVGWFVTPFAWLLNTSAYIQEVREQPDSEAFMPAAFPVITAAVAESPGG